LEPLISMHIDKPRREFEPGDTLSCQYQVDAVDPGEIQSLEVSVLWHTEGKGDEDLRVHYFERRVATEEEGGDLRQLRQFRTQLPNSPLSFDGRIVKIRWCVRIRVYLKDGKESFYEQSFSLGRIPRPAKIPKHAVPFERGTAVAG